MSIFTAVASLFAGGTDSGGNGKNGEPAESEPKPTVLVIDDDAKFLQTMRVVLADAGYGVLTSSTGPKGLDMLRYAQRDVGVVLLDFAMPRFSGADTLEYLRRLNGQVKVIGMSGFKVNELPESFQQGVDHVVLKPFNNGELLRAIEAVLRRNSAAQSTASA
jgi:DNA-binding response OmpR family regulator